MTRASTWVLALLASIAAAMSLAGCSGCEVDPHAQAQGPDGGGVGFVQPGPSPSATATCFLIATRYTGLTDLQIQDLCRGAPTPTGPADCYVASRRLSITDDQRLLLCRCSGSTEPVACFRRIDSETGLTDDQIGTLCSPTLVLGLLGNCRPYGGY